MLKPGDMVKINRVIDSPKIAVRFVRYCDIDVRVETQEFDVMKDEVGIVLALVECPVSRTPECMVLFGTRFGWTWDNCWKPC